MTDKKKRERSLVTRVLEAVRELNATLKEGQRVQIEGDLLLFMDTRGGARRSSPD